MPIYRVDGLIVVARVPLESFALFDCNNCADTGLAKVVSCSNAPTPVATTVVARPTRSCMQEDAPTSGPDRTRGLANGYQASRSRPG
jgi:hypothetical protein